MSQEARSVASSWDYKLVGYEAAIKVIRRVWPVRNHPGIDRMVLRRAIAQAQRCSRLSGQDRTAAQDQSYTRQAVIEYRGQVVKVLILRSFWRFRRVMMAVKGEQYRLTWIRAKRIWFYEQIEPELWNDRKVWS